MEKTAGLKAVGTRVAEWSDAFLVWAKRTAKSLAEDIRSRDRYSRMKAGVVLAWATLSLVAILVASSSPKEPAANRLGAYVTVRTTPLSWALLVHNRSSRPWTDVRIRLDGGHALERERIDPDERLVLSPRQFLHDGVPLQSEEPPKGVEIESGGTLVRPLLAID